MAFKFQFRFLYNQVIYSKLIDRRFMNQRFVFQPIPNDWNILSQWLILRFFSGVLLDKIWGNKIFKNPYILKMIQSVYKEMFYNHISVTDSELENFCLLKFNRADI